MPHAALREVLARCRNWTDADVRISGDDPVLPIRYRVAAAASASLGSARRRGCKAS